MRDGTDPSQDWIGIVPFSDMPRVVNPRKGYLVSANNRISSEHVKWPINTDVPSTSRAQRIDDMITNIIHKEKRKITVQDMVDMQMDVIDLTAESGAQSLLALLRKNRKAFLSKYPGLSTGGRDKHLDIID